LEQELSNNKLEGFEESISQLNKGSNQILDLFLLINEQKLDNCLKDLATFDNGLEKIENFKTDFKQTLLNQEILIKDNTEFIYKEFSQNFRFLGEKLEQSSHKVQNQKGFNDEMPLVLEQGLPSLIIVVVAILIAFSLVVIGVLKFIKKRKQSGINKQQLRMEKLKFLPRVAIPSEAIFSESKSGLNGIIPNKSGKTKSGGQNMLSPTYRTTHALKLEENHHSSVINENIFTNIDNSPKSLDDDSPTSSVRNTPKDINFNIEFSMIEQDSKIKSARDNEE